MSPALRGHEQPVATGRYGGFQLHSAVTLHHRFKGLRTLRPPRLSLRAFHYFVGSSSVA